MHSGATGVIMPTHLHAMVFDHEYDAASLAKCLNDFRRYTGRILADDAV